jgi:RNA polymerase sigma factor (sigma-70 family)
MNPLAETAATDPEDQEDVRRAQQGSREALERLIVRHQPWIYNIVLRMVYFPADAEDATQEILIKLLTKLSTFEGKSSVRTWLYRIACNHVLNMQRRRGEEKTLTFSAYQHGLDRSGDSEPPDPAAVPADVQLLVEEAKIGCTTGMLLCLDRKQRLIFAPEITYFDPTTAARIDGREALVAMITPFTGKIQVSRFDMQQPKVQRRGDTAVLTFNLVSYRGDSPIARWNATEVYGRIDGAWRITHSHWSYITPELKETVTELSSSATK